MGIFVGGLVILGHFTIAVSVLIALWGMVFAVVQVGWTDWLTRAIPDQLESGGGIQIAAIQLAITIGAAVGDLVYDITLFEIS